MLALAAALVFAGCGEKRHTSSHSSSGSSSATISESEFKLTPSSASVPAGGTITVKNTGKFPHALVIPLKNGDIRTRTLSPGQSVEANAPDKAGSYAIYCPIDHHKQKGMVGKLTVGSGGGASTSSSPPPSQSPGGY